MRFDKPSKISYRTLDPLSTEELEEKIQSLEESDKPLFGETARDRYERVSELYDLPLDIIPSRDDFASESDYRKALKRNISIMTGGYERQRARIGRDNIVSALESLGAPDELIARAKKIKPKDIARHAEEYQYLFDLMETYEGAKIGGEEDNKNSDLIESFAYEILKMDEREAEGVALEMGLDPASARMTTSDFSEAMEDLGINVTPKILTRFGYVQLPKKQRKKRK